MDWRTESWLRSLWENGRVSHVARQPPQGLPATHDVQRVRAQLCSLGNKRGLFLGFAVGEHQDGLVDGDGGLVVDLGVVDLEPDLEPAGGGDGDGLGELFRVREP